MTQAHFLRFLCLVFALAPELQAQFVEVYGQEPTFQFYKGHLTPAFENVILNGTGNFTVTSISNPVGWITANPLTVTLPAVLNITVDPTGLPYGEYKGLIVLKSGTYSHTISVRLGQYDTTTATQGKSGVIAHIAEGGALSGGVWRTAFTLTNPTTQKQRITVDFFSDTGLPLPLPIEGLPGANTGFFVDLDPYATGYVVTSGTSPQILTGWASVSTFPQTTTTPAPSVTAVFSQTVSNRPDVYEGAVAMEFGDAKATTVPVYTWGGLATGIAMTNSAPTSITVGVVGRDAFGQILLSTNISLPAKSHTAFSVVDRFPALRNRLGTLTFTPRGLAANSQGGLSIIALRFTSTGSFTRIETIKGN